MEYGSLDIWRWYLSLRWRGVIVWVKLERGLEIGGAVVSAHLEAAASTIEVPFSEGKMTKPLAHRSVELVGVEYPLQQRVGSMD